MGASNMIDAPVLPGYEVISLLGQGGCGSVFLARQTSLGRQVAIKVVLPERSGSGSMRERLRREGRLMAQIEHVNLMRVYDVLLDGPTVAVVLEYLPAGTLKDRIGQDGRRAPLAPAAVMLLAEELLSALTALHAAGVVHRDLKPANVLFRSTGQAVLADLGVARIPDSEITRLTAAGQLIGTLAYLPPESFKDPVVGITGDLFALGVTLHEALTGLHPTGFRPFPSMFEPRDPALALPDCPASLGRLIVALLQPTPERRPVSARIARELLGELPAKGTSAFQSAPPPMQEEDVTTLRPAADTRARSRKVPATSRKTASPATPARGVRRVPLSAAALAILGCGLFAYSCMSSRTTPSIAVRSFREEQATVVEVLGFTRAASRDAVWIKASQPARVRWGIAGQSIPVGGAPVHLYRGSSSESLEQSAGGGPWKSLSIPWPGQLPPTATLGLIVHAERHRDVRQTAGGPPLAAWLADTRLASVTWLRGVRAPLPPPPALVSRLLARVIPSVVEVPIDGEPGRCGWETGVIAAAAAAVVLDMFPWPSGPDGLPGRIEQPSDPEGHAKQLLRWKAFWQEHMPSAAVLACPVDTIFPDKMDFGVALAARIEGAASSIVVPGLDVDRTWAGGVRDLRAAAREQLRGAVGDRAVRAGQLAPQPGDGVLVVPIDGMGRRGRARARGHREREPDGGPVPLDVRSGLRSDEQHRTGSSAGK